MLLLLGFAPMSFADIVSGTVAKYQLNGGLTTDRGVCVRLSPELSGTGWACLYKSNALYNEITALLLAAYLTQTPVSIWSDQLEADGHRLIDSVE